MARTLICLRYLLIGGAIVVGVCGVIESICASYFIYQLYEYSFLTPSNVCGSAIVLLLMGLITCMIGWCAWQFLDFTNTGQVIIFSIALTIITISNTSAGIWTLVRHEQVDLLPAADIQQIFQNATTDNKSAWDHVQSKLHCCGINGPTDYHLHDAIPWSCCDTTSITNPSNNKGVCTTMYARGCQHIVLKHTRSILLHIFLLALCTVLLQVCFVICMCCYVKACRQRIERRKELMNISQLSARASKDLGTNDNLLSHQLKYSKSTPDI